MPRVGSLFWTDEYRSKPHTRDDEYIDAFDPSPPGSGIILKVFHYCFVLTALGLMAAYTVKIVNEYHENQAEPPTVTSWASAESFSEGLRFPTMIICPSVTVPLTLDACFQDQYSSKTKKTDSWECDNRPFKKSADVIKFYNFTSPWVDDKLDYYSCVVINAIPDEEEQLYTRQSGAQNDIWLSLEMDWANIGNQSDNWVGLYVLLLENGTDSAQFNGEITMMDIANTPLVVSGGVVNVVSLTKNIQSFQGESTVINYDFSLSSVPWGPGTFSSAYSGENAYGAFAVSVSYNNLAVQTITQKTSYTLENMLGDFAGMIGALCGIDALKTLVLIQLFPKFCMAVYRKATGQASPE